MKKVKEIQKVHKIDKNSDFIFVRTEIVEKNEVSDDNFLIPIKYEVFSDVRLVWRYIDKNNFLEIFNTKTKQFDIKISNSHWIKENLKFENNFLLPHLNSDKIDDYVNFKLKRKYTFNKEGVGSIFYDNLIIETPFFLKPQNKLTCFKLNDFENELWYFQLPEGFKFFGKIQILKNVLFFIAFKDDGNYNKQYGLDIITGKILWELNFQIPYKKNNIAFHINPKDSLCYGYGGNLYQVFNPITGEVLVEKNMSSYYEQDIDPGVHTNAIYNNKLWFVSGRRGENAKFGAIDLKTHKMDFIQDYPLENGGQFDKPVYHKGKLYLRDSNNVLHIFKKQENIA